MVVDKITAGNIQNFMNSMIDVTATIQLKQFIHFGRRYTNL